MSPVTDDPADPRLTRGVDAAPTPIADAYLVLSDAERAKGFVRPLRTSYVHVGRPAPRFPLLDLTEEQQATYAGAGYVKYESYPESEAALGHFWRQEELDDVGKGCGAVTVMAAAIAETYARNPGFYGATYCVGCNMHRPVGPAGEFDWDPKHGEVIPADRLAVGS